LTDAFMALTHILSNHNKVLYAVAFMAIPYLFIAFISFIFCYSLYGNQHNN